MNNDAIAEILKRLRIRKHLTQKDVAAKINVTHQAVSRWERGESIPDIQTLILLAQFYDVTVDAILGKSAMYAPESVELDSVNNLLKGIVRYFLLPLGIILSVMGLVLFFGYTQTYTAQLLLVVLTCVGLLLLVYKKRIHKNGRLFVIGILTSVLIFGSIYAIKFDYFNRMEIPKFYAENQIDFYPGDFGESMHFYFRSGEGDEEHAYTILYEEGQSYIQIFDLDGLHPHNEYPSSFIFRELTLPLGWVENVFSLSGELHVSTHEHNQEVTPNTQTTHVYRLNAEMDGFTEVTSIDGIYLVNEHVQRIEFYPAYFGNNTGEVYYYDEAMDVNYPISDEVGPFLSFVEHVGIYASVDIEYGVFGIVYLRNDYSVWRQLEETFTEGEVPLLSTANVKTLAQTNDMAWLLENGEVIVTLEKPSPGFISVTPQQEFLLNGSLYDGNLQLISTSTFDYKENYGVHASYLTQDTEQNYFAILPGSIFPLYYSTKDVGVFIDSYARHVWFGLSVLVLPTLIIAGIKPKAGEILE